LPAKHLKSNGCKFLKGIGVREDKGRCAKNDKLSGGNYKIYNVSKVSKRVSCYYLLTELFERVKSDFG
jgi:hypothetical protein